MEHSTPVTVAAVPAYWPLRWQERSGAGSQVVFPASATKRLAAFGLFSLGREGRVLFLVFASICASYAPAGPEPAEGGGRYWTRTSDLYDVNVAL